MSYVEYDKERLKEEVSSEDVVNALNIPFQRKGKTIQILCGGHNDHNYGSCYLTEYGCMCHSCGRSYDIFNMIQWSESCTFAESLAIAAEISGNKDAFIISKDNEQSYRNRPLFPYSLDELKLIGLKNSLSAFPIRMQDNKILSAGEKVEEFTKDHFYVIEKTSLYSLKQLYKDDRQMFFDLVLGKIDEVIDYCVSLLNSIENNAFPNMLALSHTMDTDVPTFKYHVIAALYNYIIQCNLLKKKTLKIRQV